MLYSFEISRNATVEATKKICCQKGEDAFDTSKSDQMAPVILLGLQEPQQSGKVMEA